MAKAKNNNTEEPKQKRLLSSSLLKCPLLYPKKTGLKSGDFALFMLRSIKAIPAETPRPGKGLKLSPKNCPFSSAAKN